MTTDRIIRDTENVLWRYHRKAVEKEKTPSLLGQALAGGGMERIKHYKNIVSTLLRNNPADIEQLRASTRFFI